jgi:predicted metal-dependent phosphoesterase TrpH
VIDLHAHSNASDGSFSPGELVALARKRGLSALALTDHDTVAGLAEAESAASEEGIRFIRGVEIEVEFNPGEFHLLGLDFPALAPGLAEILGVIAKKRETRNRTIVERLSAAGHELRYEELLETAGSSMVGRPHIAELLVRKRIARTRQQAFDRFIGKGKPFWEPKAAITLEEGVDLIHKAGGLAFVAHPMSLFVSWKRLRELFPAWKEIGVDGIEAWHPTARKAECERLEDLAEVHGFRVSAGSDFHGAIRPDRKLGLTAGNREIDDRFLVALER